MGALVASTILSGSAFAFTSNLQTVNPTNQIIAYLEDEGTASSFVDGADNGYFRNSNANLALYNRLVTPILNYLGDMGSEANYIDGINNEYFVDSAVNQRIYEIFSGSPVEGSQVVVAKSGPYTVQPVTQTEYRVRSGSSYPAGLNIPNKLYDTGTLHRTAGGSQIHFYTDNTYTTLLFTYSQFSHRFLNGITRARAQELIDEREDVADAKIAAAQARAEAAEQARVDALNNALATAKANPVYIPALEGWFAEGTTVSSDWNSAFGRYVTLRRDGRTVSAIRVIGDSRFQAVSSANISLSDSQFFFNNFKLTNAESGFKRVFDGTLSSGEVLAEGGVYDHASPSGRAAVARELSVPGTNYVFHGNSVAVKTSQGEILWYTIEELQRSFLNSRYESTITQAYTEYQRRAIDNKAEEILDRSDVTAVNLEKASGFNSAELSGGVNSITSKTVGVTADVNGVAGAGISITENVIGTETVGGLQALGYNTENSLIQVPGSAITAQDQRELESAIDQIEAAVGNNQGAFNALVEEQRALWTELGQDSYGIKPKSQSLADFVQEKVDHFTSSTLNPANG